MAVRNCLEAHHGVQILAWTRREGVGDFANVIMIRAEVTYSLGAGGVIKQVDWVVKTGKSKKSLVH